MKMSIDQVRRWTGLKIYPFSHKLGITPYHYREIAKGNKPFDIIIRRKVYSVFGIYTDVVSSRFINFLQHLMHYEGATSRDIDLVIGKRVGTMSAILSGKEPATPDILDLLCGGFSFANNYKAKMHACIHYDAGERVDGYDWDIQALAALYQERAYEI